MENSLTYDIELVRIAATADRTYDIFFFFLRLIDHLVFLQRLSFSRSIENFLDLLSF